MAKNSDKNTIKDIELCQGIRLSKSTFEAKENRLLTLLVKGVVVYLLSMGSIGFYLSAFSIEYNAFVCHVVVFLMALASAMLYYRLLTENVGYLIVLTLFCVLVYKFRTYINSGFYAIVNITTDGAAQYFNIDIQRIYAEQIENRYVTITFAVLFIGVVLDIFLNVYISRRMQYVTVIFCIMGLNMVPLYLVFEPDGIYSIMVLGGIALAYVFRSGKHYSPQVSIKRDDIKYKEKARKWKKNKPVEISYVYDAKAMVNAGIIALAFVVALVPVVSAFKPKDSFNVGYQGNKYKQLTMAAVSTILMDGLTGFFRMSRDVGGLESGKLGQVSTIRLDYQTDLVVQLTPYTLDRIYFKGFTGVQYNPYANSWTSIKNINGINEQEISAEAQALKDEYLEGYEYSAEAIIRVNNVEDDVIYKPYYCYSYEENRQFLDMLIYPRFEESKVLVNEEYYEGAPYSAADLYVPPENIEAVESFINQLDDPLNNKQVIQQVIDYYQENYPYTIQPGKTPYRQDFVNDFLMEKKKGYCSHYASAAVLIFRYMGIPARYVEGYAIDLEQIYNAELVEGAEYKDYYDGYSQLGETALISVNVTDADAHAWVEVYDPVKGWYPLEVTPYSTTTEEDQDDFWSMFADMMDDTGNMGDGAIDNALGGGAVINKVVKNTVYILVGILLLGLAIIVLIKTYVWLRYMLMISRANLNDKLIYKYQQFCKTKKKKDKSFIEKINYRQQLEYLTENIAQEDSVEDIEKSREKTIAILEKAGFSQDIISQDEYDYVINWCKENA